MTYYVKAVIYKEIMIFTCNSVLVQKKIKLKYHTHTDHQQHCLSNKTTATLPASQLVKALYTHLSTVNKTTITEAEYNKND